MNIPVKILPDDKGYFDRECPNPKCLFTFKINMEDWEDKVSDDEVHCPLCGYKSPSDKWWTQAQLRQIETIAANYATNLVQRELNKVFGELARSTINNKYCRITYTPGRQITFYNNPIGQREEWATEITCEKCGTRYSVIGSAFFCPCCGFNSAISAFNDSMKCIRNMLDSLPSLRESLIDKLGNDATETMCRNLLEDTIKNLVSAFQQLAARKYEELTGKPARPNDFQIVEKGNRLFFEAMGKSYDAWLSESELVILNRMIQQRHLIEHCGGIVDQHYINKSCDVEYSVGQRIVIRNHDAYVLHDIINKLGTGLISIVKEVPSCR